MMDREGLSKGLKEMVDANTGPSYEIAIGMRVSEDINQPTMINIKDLGGIKTPVPLQVSM